MDIAASEMAINGAGEPQDVLLRPVQQTELSQYWPLIKAGVEKIAEHSVDDWIVEDVYMSIKQGASFLYVAFVASYYVGFLVVTPTIGWTGPQLHVWLCYNRGERDVLETFLPTLRQIAKERGAQKITMTSPRRGWEKRAIELGFGRGQTHYQLEV